MGRREGSESQMMTWKEIGAIWGSQAVRLLDSRHASLQPGERVAYRLPAFAFVLVTHGEARVSLGKVEQWETAPVVLHGGKGATLHIEGVRGSFDYELILYKPLDDKQRVGHARETAPGQAALDRSIYEYSFQPSYPLSLQALAERMRRCWQSGEELERVQAMGLFYQFVYELLQQLRQAGAQAEPPDLASQIARHLHEVYDQPLGMDMLAERFHYSTRYLARVFKRKYGRSPLDYIMQLRMEQAKSLLARSDAPVSHIARSVGYTDMYYFSRLFKKNTGVTPAQFKLRSLHTGSICTKNTSELLIAPQASEGYINKENHYHQTTAWRVDEMNTRYNRILTAVLLLSLTMLVAACGGGGAKTETAGSGSPSGQTPAQQEETTTAQTRTYTDARGRAVEIPTRPERVVALTYGGYLLPLGMKPVGSDQMVLDVYPKEMADVPSIGDGLGNVETITALDPDLILLPEYHEPSVYDSLQQIAPTVAISWGGDADVVPTLRAIGDVLNRKEQAEAWITKFEDKLKTLREQAVIHVPAGTTAVSFILYKGEVLLGGEGGTLGKLIYGDLGFALPEQFKSMADGGGVISLETLVHPGADYFFTQMNEEELAQMEAEFQQPIYQTVPAIKEGRVINVARNKWNFGPYLAEQAVDELFEKLNASFK
ncbi:helix-turn-helix domain-containing protein [Paenibacillus sp. SYP-B4298]|uniref:helix-turn-helix domain-containing protein n=1 Tax=Paenibacillus sp. SYP-B4298 TaxID=2996034 RepID=UPI0022DE2D33|nr:helix-turn-helix domain-containing protein [Paenibacillus sp. SYP-B4298]